MSCGIYKITNLINGKIYIGQSINIKSRFYDHCKKNDSSLVGKAIQKYGKQNFSFEIIEECPPEKLDEQEQYWIAYYDCCILDGQEKGYNRTRGGQNNRIDYYKNILDLWNKGKTCRQIGEELGKNRQAVARALQAQGITLQQIKTRGLGKRVEKYNTAGTLLSIYDSVQELLRNEKTFNSTDLYRCLNHHVVSCHGFLFRYVNDEITIEELVKKYNDSTTQVKKVKKVLQYDCDGNFITEYRSAREAAKVLGVNHQQIAACCRGAAKTAYGFIWQYAE